MTRFVRFTVSTATAAAYLALAPASLAGLPPGVAEGGIVLSAGSIVNGLPVNEATHINVNTLTTANLAANGGSSSAIGSLTLAGGPTPGVFTHALLLASPNGESDADILTNEIYSFRLAGPDATTLVHINAAGHVGMAPITGGGYASVNSFFRISETLSGSLVVEGSIGIVGTAAGYQDDDFPGVYGPNPFHNLIVDGDFALKSNTTYDVRLRSIIHASAVSGHSVEAFADFDPTFAVDGPYSFEFSEGFAGGGTVRDAVGGIPEPASWALIILGFGAAGAALRRQSGFGRPARVRLIADPSRSTSGKSQKVSV